MTDEMKPKTLTSVGAALEKLHARTHPDGPHSATPDLSRHNEATADEALRKAVAEAAARVFVLWFGSWPNAADALDAMVGVRKSGARKAGTHTTTTWAGPRPGWTYGDLPGSIGNVSRFFWVGPNATDDDIALPIRYVPKAKKKDRNYGLPAGTVCMHHTKKPHKLCEWL